MEFTVRTTYTRETVAALVAVSQRRTMDGQRFRRGLARGLGGVLAAAAAAGAVLFLLDLFHHLLSGRGYTWERFSPVLGVGMLLWTGLSLLLEGRRLRKQREKLTAAIWQSYPDKGQETLFRFTPEGFSYKTPVSEAQYSYSVLQDLAADGVYYFLFLNSTYVYVLKKTDFLQGEAEAFGSFLTRVTGRPVRSIPAAGEEGDG